jgi:hypothetical protein
MTRPIFKDLRADLGGIYSLELALEQLRFPVQLLGSNNPELVAPTLADLEEIRSRIEALAARLDSAPAKHLAGDEELQSLVYAAVRFTRQRIGLRVQASDLKELVLAHCPPQHRASWRERLPQSIYGFYEHQGWESWKVVGAGEVRERSELRQLIEAEGIEFWCEWRDQCFRFVDSRWLAAHADMFRWVVGPWGGGRRCRFCGTVESPQVDALLPVELERRHGRTVIGGTVVLEAGASALTHERCRPHWLHLLTTIAPYGSLAEARAADQAAGRQSRWEGVQTSAPDAEGAR